MCFEGVLAPEIHSGIGDHFQDNANFNLGLSTLKLDSPS
jgi:hypothetical protein